MRKKVSQKSEKRRTHNKVAEVPFFPYRQQEKETHLEGLAAYNCWISRAVMERKL